MQRLGVLGWPVAHSRSPAMQRAALGACGLDHWSYQLLPVPPELFAETARALPASGFVGANVTVPHKEAALEIADEATEPARAIGAANTLTFADGRVHADNTDAPALVEALPEPPAGRRALVLGAGGSARAAAWALREAGAEVVAWNRTAERLARLCEDLGARPWAPGDPPAEIVVNATVVGLDPSDDPFAALPLDRATLAAARVVVDLPYATGDTALVAAARAAGAATVDGLELLVRQGALSFERWTGGAAPLEVMRAAVRGA